MEFTVIAIVVLLGALLWIREALRRER